VALLVVAALGLVVIRRGNFPVIGASEIELALRSTLNEWFVRPRFKELLGHPLALLALWQVRWPWWARGGLLVAGVVAQASVLNSFSHYHTPLVVSLQRSVVALALAALIAGWRPRRTGSRRRSAGCGAGSRRRLN
jgi:peptidoglycan/LPS O-acetylase OafA/YrhL